MKITQTVYEGLEPGAYPAELVNVEEREGGWGSYLLFTFKIVGNGHEGVNVSGAASAKFSPKSKLYQWAKALFGQVIPRDYSLDTDNLLGRRCILELDVEETTDGTFNRIVGVRPAGGETLPTALPTSEPPTDDDDDNDLSSWPW